LPGRSMFHARTLTRRFGLLYAIVILIALGVSSVVFVQLRQIRTDSKRVMEETREQEVTNRLTVKISSSQALLVSSNEVPANLAPVRYLLREALSEMDSLGEHPGDPSREEHQEAEARLGDRMRSDLQRALELCAAPRTAEAEKELRSRLASAKHYAEVLSSHARDEASEANGDLVRRSRAARSEMLVVLVAASILLGLALTLVHRSVVRPLERLRAGAERFGNGDLAHRIHVHGSDELVDLASSFHAMADRVAEAQDHLEERVRARTHEFLRAARLADLGLLASGIAHEINTPLASIASCAEGLQRRCRDGQPPKELLAEYTDTIRQETLRARDITTRMLALVRQEPSTISKVSLGLVLDQAESALRHRAERRRVRLDREAPEQDAVLNVNAGELVQIILNLLANAVDASSPGGRVRLRAAVEGRMLVLEVVDEGPGIPEEDVDRIFEPFYTTKRPGEGTGLGLALVSTLVESRLGRISVRSQPGRGSTFRVTIPTDWSANG
jgi:two-component system NtrC family sensor kinase